MVEAQHRRSARDLFDPTLDNQMEQEALRIAEALLFASPEPITEQEIAAKLTPGIDVGALLEALAKDYAGRGVTLRRAAGKWMFRTADDLGPALQDEKLEKRNLTRAQLETLAIVVYHQPVTRAEIEEIRGVTTSKGTLDILLTTGWVRMRGRRKTPGRPVTYGTTESFLIHFGLDSIKDLPGLDELRGAGLLDARLPTGFTIPSPHDGDLLGPDEDPLEDGDAVAELDSLPDANSDRLEIPETGENDNDVADPSEDGRDDEIKE